jgi:predicted aspartyl protease
LGALISDVEIFTAFIPPSSPTNHKTYKALYDTGATHSSITPRVVADLQLAPVGNTVVGRAGGTTGTTVHLVNIRLPNHVMFPLVRVANLALRPDVDVIIGMDILAQGDFALTNHKNKTTFSFCCPSWREIDFVAEVNESNKEAAAHPPKIGLNSPCPCGSGEKYKKCCKRKRA